MNTLVGVDHGGTYVSALRMLSRLGLPDLKLGLLHVEEPVWAVSMAGLAPITFPVEETVNALRVAGTRLLGEATKLANLLGMASVSEYEVGHACSLMMNLADARQYELIAVGSEQKGSYGSFFLGSVGRGLAMGSHQSFLVAKGEVPIAGKLKIVLATDHSPYADRAIQHFLKMRPTGIEHITLLTATEIGAGPMVSPLAEFAVDLVPAIEATEKAIRARGEKLQSQLVSAGYPTDVRVVDGFPHQVIEAEMKEYNADLLVMGAQGHGFVERLLIGSASLHQVVNEPYSVMVIRA